MSTQIDPVTNLPMYVPPPLEQIPFKNPPYPWNDLTDNPVVPRTTYYGDDSIPTVSTIAGMHPTQPGGQTVNTDGNHALLVSDVNASGGGVSPIKYASNSGGTLSFGNGFHILGQFSTPTALYQVMLSWAWDGGGAFPITGPIYLELCKPGGTNGIVVGAANMYISGATTGEEKAGVILCTFNPPLSPTLSGIDDGGNMAMAVNNQTGLSFDFGWAALHS